MEAEIQLAKVIDLSTFIENREMFNFIVKQKSNNR